MQLLRNAKQASRPLPPPLLFLQSRRQAQRLVRGGRGRKVEGGRVERAGEGATIDGDALEHARAPLVGGAGDLPAHVLEGHL